MGGDRPLRHTVGAVISGRLKAAAAMPVPGSAAGTAAVPHQAPGPDRTTPGEGRRWEDGPTPTAPAWADLEQQQEQLRRGIDRHPICEADDGCCPTFAVVGEPQCPEHLGWLLCPGHDGHTCTARTRTGDQCATCQDQVRYARLDALLPVTTTDDGTCPGHNGPCGRASHARRRVLRPLPHRLPARLRPRPPGVGSRPRRSRSRRQGP